MQPAINHSTANPRTFQAVRFDSPALRIARAARQAGRSVIPVRNTRDKDQRVPLVKWTRYQIELPTVEDLQYWFGVKWPDANPVEVMGRVSGEFGLDVDGPDGLAWLIEQGLPETHTVSRGDPGRCHLRFIYPGFHVGNFRIHPQVELKGDGGTLPLPGALHWSGKPYVVTSDAPPALAPDWLLELIRPKPTPPRPARRIVSISASAVQAYGLAGLAEECARVTTAGASDANNQLFRSSAAVGSLIAAGALDEGQSFADLLSAALARGKSEPEARSTIHSGFKHGKSQPRDLSHLDRDRLPLSEVRRGKLPTFPANVTAREAAPADETAKKYKGIYGSLRDLINLLGSDDPKRALVGLPLKGQSARTARRYQAVKKCKQYESGIPLTESGRLAAPDAKRLARLRVAYPQHDKLTALIPLPDLCAALFADALSDDEADELRDVPALQALNRQQQRGLRQGQRLLKHVARLEKRLADVPFVLSDDADIRNVPDLRAELLGQICDALAEVDPVTGEKVCKLSNRVQACLLCVSTSALPAIRARRGIVQTHKATQEKPIRPGDPLPPNTFKIRVRGPEGEFRQDIYNLYSPSTTAALRTAASQHEHTFAIVQPVAEQRIGPRPERKPRALLVTVPGAGQEPVPDLVAPGPPGQLRELVPSAKRPPRRPWREVYAGQLMRNLLYHLNVEADAGEPLSDLAGKLRSVIRPGATWIERSHPERQDVDSNGRSSERVTTHQPPDDWPGLSVDQFITDVLGGTVASVTPTPAEHPGAALWETYRSFADLNKRDDWFQELDSVDRDDLLYYRYHVLRAKAS